MLKKIWNWFLFIMTHEGPIADEAKELGLINTEEGEDND